MAEMIEGQRVVVKLHGDETEYFGTVLNRPRKMWVLLDACEISPNGEFVADEANIVEWRPVITRESLLGTLEALVRKYGLRGVKEWDAARAIVDAERPLDGSELAHVRIES